MKDRIKESDKSLNKTLVAFASFSALFVGGGTFVGVSEYLDRNQEAKDWHKASESSMDSLCQKYGTDKVLDVCKSTALHLQKTLDEAEDSARKKSNDIYKDTFFKHSIYDEKGEEKYFNREDCFSKCLAEKRLQYLKQKASFYNKKFEQDKTPEAEISAFFASSYVKGLEKLDKDKHEDYQLRIVSRKILKTFSEGKAKKVFDIKDYSVKGHEQINKKGGVDFVVDTLISKNTSFR